MFSKSVLEAVSGEADLVEVGLVAEPDIGDLSLVVETDCVRHATRGSTRNRSLCFLADI